MGIGQNYTLLLFHLYYTGEKECGLHSFPRCIYTGSSKQCDWTFPAQKESQQELGVQKVSHEVTHLIIVQLGECNSAVQPEGDERASGILPGE